MNRKKESITPKWYVDSEMSMEVKTFRISASKKK